MKGIRRLALGAVLSAGMVMPVIAQSNFPDVPDNHWAYQALSQMKRDGLLIGYPDGLFKGGRPATRYELAVAVHEVYQHLKGTTDGMQSWIDSLKVQIPYDETKIPITKTDLQALKDQLAALQSDVNGMKGWGDDIANLKKMAATFEKELSSLGVDVEAMKKDLSDLAARVGVLEKNKLPITVHGDVNLLMMGGASDSHRPGIDLTGRPVGVQGATGGGLARAGFSQDLSIYHEAALRIEGDSESNPAWFATLIVGNMLGTTGIATKGPFPSQSTTGLNGYIEGPELVYFQDFGARVSTRLAGQNFTAELGRTGYSIDPYIFQRPDVTPYFAKDRWDNGRWMMDGGILGFSFGSARLNIFGGRINSELQPMNVGQIGHAFSPGGQAGRPFGLNSQASGQNTVLPVDQTLGANLSLPLGQSGTLDLAYIFLEANDAHAITNDPDLNPLPGRVARAANRAQVFGGNLKYLIGRLGLDAGFSQSNLYNGKDSVVTKDNAAWHAGMSYDGGRWNAGLGYRQIDPQFNAPGDWGRIGTWWNPTDIKGFDAKLGLNLTDRLRVGAGGEWYSGTGKTLTLASGFSAPDTLQTGLNTDDRIARYTIDLNYKLSDSWSASLGLENVEWNLKPRDGSIPGDFPFAGGRPHERWYNIGLGYNLGAMTRLTMLWQISDYNGGGDGGADIGFNVFGGARASGSLITTQISIKF